MNADDKAIIVSYNSSRVRYEQALYIHGHGSLWLDWMVDRVQSWWNYDRPLD
jgi:hypothetical protein